jgi:hypothetical protein
MRVRSALTALLVLAVVFALGVYLATQHIGDKVTLPAGPYTCIVSGEKGVGLGEVRLDPEQMANAATIAAVGIRRNFAEQAIVVAIATALQESKLRNLDHLGYTNDHDSVGLFQQRPSQGWGSAEQIADPRYASDRFYTALNKIKNWQTMRVTDAAQQVQHSAYPEAYGKWEDEARVLAGALIGRLPGSVSCTADPTPDISGKVAATALADLMRLDWLNRVKTLVTVDNGVQMSVQDQKTGWQFAHWLVSHSDIMGVTRVKFADQEWSAQRGKWSQASESAQNVAEQVVAEVQPAG